ncbi:Ig-like domain-containing protein [Flagellimonas pacifica]|uniref:Uncharacterized protein n=1 Tax=Flagellimonas pacifica TaxID=1247520 RepID=A0A285MTH0_9FLAO|nr:Ig-like domain-containing protein [Allomuricauda parva]SNZ00500.1 hypothetical protein SAMN06265377_2324 [Allomuricauda parva]
MHLPQKTFIAFLVFVSFLILNSCSSEENEIPEKVINVKSDDISIALPENALVTSSNIEVTLPNDAILDMVNIYIGSNLVESFSAAPYTFLVNSTDLAHGEHKLKVDILLDNEIVASKIVTIKVDKQGPTAVYQIDLEALKMCGETTVSPGISDDISGISRVEVFLNDASIATFGNSSDYSFPLNMDDHPIGTNTLKLVMEDMVGNITTEVLDVNFYKPILDIKFPDNFIREGVEKVHAILSDSDGNLIDYVTHSTRTSETLTLCSSIELGAETEYMLTFAQDFSNVVFSFYVYGNLTQNMVGNQIVLASRSLPSSSASINMDMPDYEDGFYVRSSTPWSSMLFYNNTFSGHVSKNFSVDELSTNKSFVMNFHPDLHRSYQWALVEDINTKFSLKAEDFMSTDVTHDFLTVNGSSLDPFLSVYGFENETHFRAMSSPHMLYWNPSLNSINGYDYSYANIFDHNLYSARVSNYGIDGIGAIPKTISVPGQSISYQFQNDKIIFNGLQNYEVGRVRLTSLDNIHIHMEFIFDGHSTGMAIPELPENLFVQELYDAFDNQRLQVIQGVAENYENIENYSEYVSNVFVNSTPFYVVSPKRERIFASSVGTQLLPIIEFPFFLRL